METKCYFCASRKLELKSTKLRFGFKGKVFNCNKCSLVFLDQKSIKLPKNFYQSKYHQTYLNKIDSNLKNPDKSFQVLKKSSQIWINKTKKILKKNSSLLDFGCSTGHFLHGLKSKTKNLYGVELNKKEAEFCKKKLNIVVSNENFEQDFSSNKFDFISMIFVLEHISDPILLLKNLKKLLTKNGKLIIVVPNINDPLIKLYDVPHFEEFYYCIEHLFYFNKKTLGQVLNKAGYSYKIENIQEYPIMNHFNWIFKKSSQGILAARQNNITFKHNSFGKRFNKLFGDFNADYKKIITRNGFGDRLWCVATKK